LIFRDARNAEHGKIAANWNVSGTRDFFHLSNEIQIAESSLFPSCQPTAQ